MNYKVVIPARANSKRLPGKNMKLLGGVPLIEHSIRYALAHFSNQDVWVNSDDARVIEYAVKRGVKTLDRPSFLGSDETTSSDVLKFQLEYFDSLDINCDAIILMQPTNPFRNHDLINNALQLFEESRSNSLVTFSVLEKKVGSLQEGRFLPLNYTFGQRSQNIQSYYYENGLLYITKSASIRKGEIVTSDAVPLVRESIYETIDIDYLHDFIYAESLMKLKL